MLSLPLLCVCGVSVWSCRCVLSASTYLSMWHTSKVERIEKQSAGLLLWLRWRICLCVMIHRHWFANINQFEKIVTVQTSARAKSIIRAQNVFLVFSSQRSHWNSNQLFSGTSDCAFDSAFCRHNVTTQFRDYFEYICVRGTRRTFGPRVTQTCSAHFVTCVLLGDTTIHEWIKLAHTHELCRITNNWLILIWMLSIYGCCYYSLFVVPFVVRSSSSASRFDPTPSTANEPHDVLHAVDGLRSEKRVIESHTQSTFI